MHRECFALIEVSLKNPAPSFRTRRLKHMNKKISSFVLKTHVKIQAILGFQEAKFNDGVVSEI